MVVWWSEMSELSHSGVPGLIPPCMHGHWKAMLPLLMVSQFLVSHRAVQQFVISSQREVNSTWYWVRWLGSAALHWWLTGCYHSSVANRWEFHPRLPDGEVKCQFWEQGGNVKDTPMPGYTEHWALFIENKASYRRCSSMIKIGFIDELQLAEPVDTVTKMN